MRDILSKFLYLFNRREKFQLLALFLLMLVGATLETFMIGLVYPYISVLRSPEIIQEHWILRRIYGVMKMNSAKEFITWITVGLIVAYILKNVFLVFLTYVQSRFVFNKRISFARQLFSFYLYQPYTFHLQRNTAELLHKLNNAVPTLFGGFLLYAMMFAVEAITVLFVFGLLISVNPLPSIVTVTIVGAVVFVFYKVIRKRVSKLSQLKQYLGEQIIRCINQGFGGLKEIKVLGKERFFVNAYNKNNVSNVGAERFMHLTNQLPRPFLETICMMCMFLLILLMLCQDKAFQSIIPTVSLFTAAAFRIIPSVNRICAAAITVRYNSYTIEVIYNDLVLENKDATLVKSTGCSQETSIIFDKALELRNVYYQYPFSKKPVLNGISVIIPKHSVVGFVGPSGAGKTTIVDVILGLLTPMDGEVLVDGKNIQENLSGWQRRIGYIPQNIYLSDDTIRCNIAFGLGGEEINNDRVWSVLGNAQLDKFVKGLPGKLETIVGERGIRLSGGERQRIGIARALYHDPDVLIMDEGTASLDNETEKGIMQAVKYLSKGKTIIIIAHRLSTIKDCDCLYFIKDGTVIERGTYDELFEKSSAFKSMVMSTEYK